MRSFFMRTSKANREDRRLEQRGEKKDINMEELRRRNNCWMNGIGL